MIDKIFYVDFDGTIPEIGLLNEFCFDVLWQLHNLGNMSYH